jgi:hypothetical protein
MSTRIRTWQEALAACIAERQARPFAWGDQDCARFPAACVQAMTGADPMAAVPAYSTAAEAARIIGAAGGLGALAAARLGPEVLPAAAQVGDVGLLANDGRECLAVWGGDCWLAAGEQGLVRLPLAAALRVWRV